MSQLLRFAVLHHTGIDEPHFDLLFESSATSQLVTFRLNQWPLHESQDATKLRDHRRAYLTLQGDISMGRGHVERVDEGDVYVEQLGGAWELKHPDGRLMARIEPLGSESDDNWWIKIPTNPQSA